MRVTLLSPAGEKSFVQNRLVKRISSRLRGIVRFMVDDTEQIPCLALLTIAGLFPENTIFQYIDEEHSEPDQTIPEINGFQPDLICVTAISHQGPRARQLLAQLRSESRHTLLGGMLASGDPDSCRDWADTLFTGEAEAVFPTFLNDLTSGTPQRRYSGHTRFDLDDSPLPRYDLLPDPMIYDKWPLFASRGCPHGCEFCGVVSVYGKQLRHKSISRIQQEIQAIRQFVARPFLSFSDENLTLNPDWAMELAQMLSGEKLGFECYVDISFGQHSELIDAFARAGCREVAIGLESIIPESLSQEARFKAKKLADYKKLIHSIQSRGIAVFGLFIVGLDGDGPEVFERILEFCDQSGLANAEFAALSPVPGTPLHARLSREKRLLSTAYEEYRWEKHEYIPAQMTPDGLKKGIMRLYADFHHPDRVRKRRAILKSILRNRMHYLPFSSPGC